MILNFLKNRNRSGQGLLEIMAAIYIIAIGILSVLNLVMFNFQVETFNYDMLIGTNLAREGAELVRHVRDSNWAKGVAWDNDLMFVPNGELPQEENSFYLGYLFYKVEHPNGDDFDVSSYPLGMSWDQCTSQFFMLGNSYVCKLYLIPFGVNDEKTIYSYFGEDYENAIPTKFFRIIYINEICLNEATKEESILTGFNQHCSNSSLKKIGLQVISKVGWQANSGMKTVSVEERLYNWREK